MFLELIKQASFSNWIWSRDLGTFLSLLLKSCKNEESLMALGLAFRTMAHVYLTLFLPSSPLYRVREKSLVSIIIPRSDVSCELLWFLL